MHFYERYAIELSVFLSCKKIARRWLTTNQEAHTHQTIYLHRSFDTSLEIKKKIILLSLQHFIPAALPKYDGADCCLLVMLHTLSCLSVIGLLLQVFLTNS